MCTDSLQVTVSHPPGGRLPLLSATCLQLPSQPQSITAVWPVPSYTAWWQRHIGRNNLPEVVTQRFAPNRIWTRDLLIASPTLYPLLHRKQIGESRFTRKTIVKTSKSSKRTTNCSWPTVNRKQNLVDVYSWRQRLQSGWMEWRRWWRRRRDAGAKSRNHKWVGCLRLSAADESMIIWSSLHSISAPADDHLRH